MECSLFLKFPPKFHYAAARRSPRIPGSNYPLWTIWGRYWPQLHHITGWLRGRAWALRPPRCLCRQRPCRPKANGACCSNRNRSNWKLLTRGDPRTARSHSFARFRCWQWICGGQTPLDFWHTSFPNPDGLMKWILPPDSRFRYGNRNNPMGARLVSPNRPVFWS